MKFPRCGRLWQIERNITLPENVRQAMLYLADRHGETFTIVVMRPEDRESIDSDYCCGLKLISDTSVTPGCIFLARQVDQSD